MKNLSSCLESSSSAISWIMIESRWLDWSILLLYLFSTFFGPSYISIPARDCSLDLLSCSTKLFLYGDLDLLGTLTIISLSYSSSSSAFYSTILFLPGASMIMSLLSWFSRKFLLINFLENLGWMASFFTVGDLSVFWKGRGFELRWLVFVVSSLFLNKSLKLLFFTAGLGSWLLLILAARVLRLIRSFDLSSSFSDVKLLSLAFSAGLGLFDRN